MSLDQAPTHKPLSINQTTQVVFFRHLKTPRTPIGQLRHKYEELLDQ